jgi:hypothetical protein
VGAVDVVRVLANQGQIVGANDLNESLGDGRLARARASSDAYNERFCGIFPAHAHRRVVAGGSYSTLGGGKWFPSVLVLGHLQRAGLRHVPKRT